MTEIHMIKDRHLIVCHDTNLIRLTGVVLHLLSIALAHEFFPAQSI